MAIYEMDIQMQRKDESGNIEIHYPITRLKALIGAENIMTLRHELLPEDVGDGIYYINAGDVTETGIYWGTAEAHGWSKFPLRSGPFVMEVINTPGGQTMRRITFTDDGEMYISVGDTSWTNI